MALTDAHRLLLQSFMSRGIMTEAELTEVFKHSCKHFQVAETSPERFLRDINPHIQSVSMEIRTGKDEITGDNVYALVRTTESELGRLSTDYTSNDLELFKKMLDLIVESDTRVASSTDILNLTNDLEKRMSKADAENVLQSLVRDKWLTNIQGEIALSSRAILELEHYLQEVYTEEYIQGCNICKKIVLRGSVCYQCNIRIHYYCARRFFQNQTHVLCPNCKKPWTDEFASTDEDEDEQPTQTSQLRPSGSSTRKRRDRRV